MTKKFIKRVLPAVTLFSALGASTCEQPAQLVQADFSAPQAIELVCLHLVGADELGGTFCPEDVDENGNVQAGEVAFETIAVEGCNLLNASDVEADNDTATVVPNSFLFALVANTTRGDVGAVSLSGTPQIIDSDNTVPGGNFIPVGNFPAGIAVDAINKRFVTANAGDNNLSVFKNTDLIRCFSNRTPPPTVDLGGSPRDVALDKNGFAYVTLPDQGELVAVDLNQDPPTIVGRANLKLGAPGAMRPTRLTISEPRRVAYVSNAAGNAIAEVDLETLATGAAPLVNFIDVQSRTGAIDYLAPGVFEFAGTLSAGQSTPDSIDIPETLYVGSLDFIGQVLLVDVQTRALVNLRPNDPQSFGPGIRIGGAGQILNPVVDIDFFTEPLLPLTSDTADPVFLPRQEKPFNLQGVFALVTTTNANAFVINIAANEPERRCCPTDGDPNTCLGGSIPVDNEGNCPEGVFLPIQAPHTVRNTTLEDEPIISNLPQLFVAASRINLSSEVVLRFPTIGNDSGCLGGEGLCGFDPLLDPKIKLPPKAQDVFTEDWVFVFEGVIGGTLRTNGAIVGNTLEDNAEFCARGIEPGDILQILTPIEPNAPAECENLPVVASVNANGAFDASGSALDEAVTAELIVTEVFSDHIVFAPRANAINPPVDLAACYPSAIQYRLRVHDAFLASGREESHNFLHRQVTNPDGTCSIDASIDPLFDARAVPGTTFNNIVFSLEITNPAPPSNGVETASFRDVAWQFTVSASFGPWAIDPDTTANTGGANIAGGVVVTPDGTSAFMTDSNQDRIYELLLPIRQANLNFID
jgi:DNA-binding beta-propeller fold protein YncE